MANLSINIFTGNVYSHGRRVDLTMAEYRLLLWFWLQPAEMFSKRELIQHIYNDRAKPHVIHATVSRINRRFRRKVILSEGRRYRLFKTGEDEQ